MFYNERHSRHYFIDPDNPRPIYIVMIGGFLGFFSQNEQLRAIISLSLCLSTSWLRENLKGISKNLVYFYHCRQNTHSIP